MWHEIEELEKRAKQEIKNLTRQEELFISKQDRTVIEYPFGKLHPLLILFDGQEFV